MDSSIRLFLTHDTEVKLGEILSEIKESLIHENTVKIYEGVSPTTYPTWNRQINFLRANVKDLHIDCEGKMFLYLGKDLNDVEKLRNGSILNNHYCPNHMSSLLIPLVSPTPYTSQEITLLRERIIGFPVYFNKMRIGGETITKYSSDMKIVYR